MEAPEKHFENFNFRSRWFTRSTTFWLWESWTYSWITSEKFSTKLNSRGRKSLSNGTTWRGNTACAEFCSENLEASGFPKNTSHQAWRSHILSFLQLHSERIASINHFCMLFLLIIRSSLVSSQLQIEVNGTRGLWSPGKLSSRFCGVKWFPFARKLFCSSRSVKVHLSWEAERFPPTTTTVQFFIATALKLMRAEWFEGQNWTSWLLSLLNYHESRNESLIGLMNIF